MAIRKLKTGEERQRNDLLPAIVDELRRPDDWPAAAGAPVVFMDETGTPERYAHWYVVWEEFRGVDDEERSRLVLAAVREVLGPQEALRVTIAMGLTPGEAREMGLPE